jgi:hypothetical protein
MTKFEELAYPWKQTHFTPPDLELPVIDLLNSFHRYAREEPFVKAR